MTTFLQSLTPEVGVKAKEIQHPKRSIFLAAVKDGGSGLRGLVIHMTYEKK